jgi:hypothetical protein
VVKCRLCSTPSRPRSQQQQNIFFVRALLDFETDIIWQIHWLLLLYLCTLRAREATESRNRAEIYVWHEGFDDWRLAKDVTELGGAGPPPVPLIATPNDAKFLPADARPQGRSRKARWFMIGASIGLVYALSGLPPEVHRGKMLFFLRDTSWEEQVSSGWWGLLPESLPT